MVAPPGELEQRHRAAWRCSAIATSASRSRHRRASRVAAIVRTIDGVFDDIQQAIDQHAAQIQLSFDPTLGYPTAVFVDHSHQIVDEELALQLSGLTTLPVK